MVNIVHIIPTEDQHVSIAMMLVFSSNHHCALVQPHIADSIALLVFFNDKVLGFCKWKKEQWVFHAVLTIFKCVGFTCSASTLYPVSSAAHPPWWALLKAAWVGLFVIQIYLQTLSLSNFPFGSTQLPFLHEKKKEKKMPLTLAHTHLKGMWLSPIKITLHCAIMKGQTQ